MLKLTLFVTILTLSSPLFALIGGKVAKTGEGTGVLQIFIQDNKSEDNYNLCTATKVGKNVLLTAAHCFENINERSDILGFTEQANNSDFSFDGVEISKVVTHPSYVLEDEIQGNDEDLPVESIGGHQIDIAIVFVKPGTNFDDIEIRKMDFDFVNPQTDVEIWGYGCQKTTNYVDDYLPIKKYGISKILDELILLKDYGELTQAVHNEAATIYQNTLLTMGLNLNSQVSSVCFGDSGGPVFKNGKLVGVNATYLAKNMDKNGNSPSGKTDVNIHQRLSAVKDWIVEELGK